jgi:hypothetical protein
LVFYGCCNILIKELPNFTNYIEIPESWDFNKDHRESYGLLNFKEFNVVNLKILFLKNPINSKKDSIIDVEIYLNKSIINGLFRVKSRWRPYFPTGIIEFQYNKLTHKYFLIISNENLADNNMMEKYSDLSNSEQFEGEAFNYYAINQITSNSLNMQIMDCDLVYSDSISNT